MIYMEKKLLNNKEDFDVWYDNLPDSIRNRHNAEAEHEAMPNYYPCIVSWYTCYDLGIFREDYVFYHFIYLSDFN